MSGTSKKTEIAIRRQQIAAAYLRGGTQAEIATELGCDQATVSRDLKALRAEWMRSALIDINEAKARELAKIDALELEYWQAWKRSQEDAESEITKMQGTPPKQGDANPAPAKLETQKKREGQSGNPAFLRGVEWCINKRCEIIGVNAPIKQEIGLTVYEVTEDDPSEEDTD
jgi:predicted transcriptional regulator